MSQFIRITDVQVLNNPAPISQNLQFRICYESDITTHEQLQWDLIFVGSATSQKFDQNLESFNTPVNTGRSCFNLESRPPNLKKVPTLADLYGPTAIIFSISIKNQEFYRIGFYVINYYADKILQQSNPTVPVYCRMYRNILSEKPRISKFDIGLDLCGDLSQNSKFNLQQQNYLCQNFNKNDDNCQNSNLIFKDQNNEIDEEIQNCNNIPINDEENNLFDQNQLQHNFCSKISKNQSQRFQSQKSDNQIEIDDKSSTLQQNFQNFNEESKKSHESNQFGQCFSQETENIFNNSFIFEDKSNNFIVNLSDFGNNYDQKYLYDDNSLQKSTQKIF